eukprot:snap_masked-scaffold_2-processed-gene-24.9-mRNA-1 protein AED:1.00 eAED:1.00 QI:0/0/0/0/1/1/5/0/247
MRQIRTSYRFVNSANDITSNSTRNSPLGNGSAKSQQQQRTKFNAETKLKFSKCFKYLAKLSQGFFTGTDRFEDSMKNTTAYSLETFGIEENEHSYIGLETSVPGIHILYVAGNPGDESNERFDPMLSLWKRPRQLIETVDNFGPLNQYSIIHFEVSDDEVDDVVYVADVFAAQRGMKGSFRMSMTVVDPEIMNIDSTVELSFSTLVGAGGRLVFLEQDVAYSIFCIPGFFFIIRFWINTRNGRYFEY